ncbi:MAG: hypothetical protein QNJ49_07140 [Mastigocoleus sp. MO_167.B18]|uniref:hypothetical protein n=1 Tax=Mastigocoleus sp. MO_188.B34 TaxID=3036635 RepID=UPI00261922B6|nr:hypothetical protein [Mastigocoleus sp. MO_188.B34]MDJ0695308.1 hypothetical protein [Mastigocoleus sp. MO_188.B34]MDJ0773191.1 hypothetical protein [Mastigocoleus sp. MO_167.B18]
MFDLGWFSAKLFMKGKLFRDPVDFALKVIIANCTGLFLLVSLELLKLPLLIPITISSLVAGATMPFLLKDFKIK